MSDRTSVVTTGPSSDLVASVGVEGGTLTVAQIKANRAHVKAIMKDLMEPGVHYGVIKGTDKPTILKPGTELLMSIFRIDGKPTVEDLSDSDTIRYRIILEGTHAPSGIRLGHGVGECSTGEEKYKWRACRSKAEWDNTPEDRTRTKYDWNEEKRQVRTNPADAANTVLKMAKKRAQSDMVLTVLAVSDIFNQDLEDTAEWLRQDDGDDKPNGNAAPNKTTSTRPPAAKKDAPEAGGKLNAQQLAHLLREIDNVGVAPNIVALKYNVDDLAELPFASLNGALQYVKSLKQEPRE